VYSSPQTTDGKNAKLTDWMVNYFTRLWPIW